MHAIVTNRLIPTRLKAYQDSPVAFLVSRSDISFKHCRTRDSCIFSAGQVPVRLGTLIQFFFSQRADTDKKQGAEADKKQRAEADKNKNENQPVPKAQKSKSFPL